MSEKQFIGDVRLKYPERDRGKPREEITDFEVWDGQRWVDAKEIASTVYPVQNPGEK